MRPASVRQKLTLWYIAVFGTILVLFGGVLYKSVGASLLKNVDKELALQADSVAAMIFAFQEAERSTRNFGPGNWQAAPSDSSDLLSDLVKRWSAQTGALQTDRIICLIDRSGRKLAASSGFDQFDKPLMESRIREALKGQTFYQTLHLPGQRLRLITRPISQYGRVRYLVQVASSLNRVDNSLRDLRIWLCWLIPVTLGVASAGGFSLATQVLRPLVRMTEQTQRISGEALDRRIDVPGTGDELERLSRAFNDMLARVERTFRRQRQFSAAASHELRTPLTVMKGELEVALRKARSTEEYQRVLRTHLEAIDDMTRTVEQLLLLARSEAVDGTAEWRPVDLSALVRRISDTWLKVARTKGVRMKMFSDEPVWVQGEGRLLERLVSNLLDNAVRHTPAERHVSVRTDHWRDKACVVVQDAGPGIPPEDLPQIFDRFFSRPPAGQAVHSTGLGLGLCRWIVEVHHGRIEVASPSGQGATFTVWLPLARPPLMKNL